MRPLQGQRLEITKKDRGDPYGAMMEYTYEAMKAIRLRGFEECSNGQPPL